VSALDLLVSLVRTPSPSGEEGPAADALASWLRERGVPALREGRNVHASLGSTGAPALLLCSHLDTVPVGDGWTRPPLEAAREGERIYGRGSNDAKASVAALAETFVALARAANVPHGKRIVLAATCEEETGRPGGLPDLLPSLGPIEAAVVGEPTGLVPVIAQKGLLALEAVVHGRQAHAARPEEGENAIVRAAEAILSLRALRFERAHPALGLPTAQVTVIKGGERRNVIPGRVELSIDVRTTPAYEPADLADIVRGALGPRVDVTIRSERLRAVDTDPDHPIVRAAVRATDGGVPRGSPTVSDWAFLRGTPAVKLGPGDSRRSHAPDEYVTEGELARGVQVYERLVAAYLGGVD
jgi:acetylornithine deacetylase